MQHQVVSREEWLQARTRLLGRNDEYDNVHVTGARCGSEAKAAR